MDIATRIPYSRLVPFKEMRSGHWLNFILLLALGSILLVLLKPKETMNVYLNKVTDNFQSDANLPHRKMYYSWKRCMMNKTAKFRTNHTETWRQIGEVTRDCEQPYVHLLNVHDYSNSDETKRHIFPVQEGEKQVVVTLGVGHDTRAEEQLLKHFGNESLEFFGADPMVPVNQELYSNFGYFFPVAISSKPGFSVTSVLDGNEYVNRLVVHVDAVYFLTKLIGKTFFDTIWMDAEGAEYQLFRMINKGEDFDQNDILICQLNLEIHSPDEMKKKTIRDFIYQTLDDERYAFFQPVQANHLRLFFVNFADEECVDKYIPKTIDLNQLPKWD